MSLFWFWPLLKCAAGPLLLLWWWRVWALSPWAVYVMHHKTKDGQVLMTVRRTHWYPPFSKYDETWHGAGGEWARESDGAIAAYSTEIMPERAKQLSAMLRAAEARAKVTEEMVA